MRPFGEDISSRNDECCTETFFTFCATATHISRTKLLGISRGGKNGKLWVHPNAHVTTDGYPSVGSLEVVAETGWL